MRKRFFKIVVLLLLAFTPKAYAISDGTGNDFFTGNVGVGTTTPQTGFVSMGNVGIGTWTAAGGNLIINGGGNVGIGTVNPPNALYVKGTMEATGFKLDGNGAGSGYVLTSNSVGVGVWMPATSGNVGIGTSMQVLLGGPANGALTNNRFNSFVFGSTNQTTEADTQAPVAIAGIFRNFCLTTTATENATAAIVTLRNNAANTNVAATITGSGAAGTYCDNTHSAAVNVNDLVDFEVTSHATATISGWSIEFDPTGGVGGSSMDISGLGVATGSNTIDNTNYAQNWQWSTLGSGNGLALSSTSTTAASNTQALFNLSLSGANATSTQTAYGTQITNTHTGTKSTNVALYTTASGGTYNYAAVFNAGNVGIGSITPGQVFDVQGTARMAGFVLTGNGVASDYFLTSNSIGVGSWTSGNGVVGTGTTHQEAVYTATAAVGSGIITDNGTNVGISSTNPAQVLDVNGAFRSVLTGDSYIDGNVGIGTTVSPMAVLFVPSLKSSTGTRYLCIDTTGKVTSSATACSGT